LRKREFIVKPFINKKTKQISIALPKKKIKFDGKVPTKLRVKIKW